VNALAEKYKGYLDIARKCGGGVIFESIEALSLCILYVLKEKVSWVVSRHKPVSQYGDWVVSAGVVEREFGIIGRAVDSELFLAVVLKVIFATSYEKLQATHPDLPPFYCLAGPGGYIEDARLLDVLNQLSEDEKGLLVEMASEVSSDKIDFMYCLGSEIQHVFSQIINPVQP